VMVAVTLPQIASDTAEARAVARCGSFNIQLSEAGSIRAVNVRRTPRISCVMARALLRSAYRLGPLKPARVVYPFRFPDGSPGGRPVIWIKGGWRCTNRADGAFCWKAGRNHMNPIHGIERRGGVAVAWLNSWARFTKKPPR